MKNFYKILLVFSFILIPIVEASEPSKAIVVTANKYASEAAAKIIKRGGTALDAAVTAQLILTMTTPQSTGIGGGGFMLYWDNFSSKFQALLILEQPPSHQSHIILVQNYMRLMGGRLLQNQQGLIYLLIKTVRLLNFILMLLLMENLFVSLV